VARRLVPVPQALVLPGRKERKADRTVITRMLIVVAYWEIHQY
jgi:hypothetical protein